MKVHVNLDTNTLDIQEQNLKTKILVTVRLDHQDIRNATVREKMTKLWADLAPLKEFIEQVILKTNQRNVEFIQPFTGLFPHPLTLIACEPVSTK